MRNMINCQIATSPATTDYEQAMNSVHRLASSGDTSGALEQIVDRSSWCLRGVFGLDENHSWYVVGDLFLKSVRYADAIIAFRLALAAWPADRQALFALGYCHSELNRPRLAERYFRRALAIDSKDRAARYNLGNALFDQGKYGRAAAEYRKIMTRQDEISDGARINARLIKNGR